MIQKIILLFIISFFLFSCGKNEPSEQETQKKDFFVDTVYLGKYAGENFISKTGRVRGMQDISLTSQASGRIAAIEVKAGDSVFAGQVLARLSDNIGSYEINLQRAGIGVERAKINYDSTQLSLDKQVFDAQQQVKMLERNLQALRLDAEKNITLLQDAADNSQYENLDSTAALQLEQLDNNIAKSELDYEIQLSTDEQQIESYKATIKKEFTTTRTVVQDVIDLSDRLLGATDANKNKNDSFEDFLGARDKNQKNTAEFELRKLIDFVSAQEYTDTVALISQDISQTEILYISQMTAQIYESMIGVLIELETTLNNSIESVGSLGPIEISGYIAQVNALQSQIQGNYAGFIATASGIETFLSSYKNSQASLLKSIELQKKDREISLKNLTSGELSAEIGLDRTILSLEDTIQDVESQLKSARNTLENAQKNREVTLRSLENSISDAQVSYASALKEYNKLVITSPINGTIGSVEIDIGQEVFSGVPLFALVSDGSPEMEISLSYQERSLVQIGQKVIIESQNGVEIEGIVYGISEVADENLNYIATIVFESGANIIGTLVHAKIPLRDTAMMLPINAISTSGEDIGVVQVFSGGTLEDVRVRMGDIRGENVEIVSCAKDCRELDVVISDTSAYNQNDFTLKKR